MIDTSELYCICDLPKIPKDLIAKIKKGAAEGIATGKRLQFEPLTYRLTSDEKEEITQADYSLTSNDRKIPIVLYQRFFVNEEIISWVKENIVADFSDIGIQTMSNGETFMPHTDGGLRIYVLNYLIHPGGEQVDLRWFRENGHPLDRGNDRPMQKYNDSELTEIHRKVFEPGTWQALYPKIIHSVNGVKTVRISLTIAMNKEQFLKFNDRWNIKLKYYG